MPKGSGQAQQTFNSASSSAGDLGGRAKAIDSGMMPTLMSNATKPVGLTPTQEAEHNTAAQQSVGGSNAGIVGQADLTAGRTGNPGSMINGIGMASRGNAKNLSNDALATKEYSTNLAQNKQQAALGEMSKLYGTNVQGLNDMVRNQNTATSNITTADNDVAQNVMKGASMVANVAGSANPLAAFGQG
jgi:hypothetical protein